MNRILLFIGLMLFPGLWTRGQEVTFESQEMEAGIRYRLGLDASTPLTEELLDSITEIDLSSMEITNISDLAFMPNLRKLDLHDNEIENVTPLLILDSLQEVNLSYNKLTSIFALSFSRSPKMVVNVAFNNISDFSVFHTMTPCMFTIEGSGLQSPKDAPYFMVSYFYCNGKSRKPTVHCRLDASTTDKAQLIADDVTLLVETDGNPHTYQLDGNFTSPCPVIVTDGTYSDSTYLVPSQTYETVPEQTMTLETGLPDHYQIRFANAIHGAVFIDGANLIYTAPDTEVSDTLSFSYYERDMLRGLSQYYLGKPQWLFGDVNRDKMVNITDIMMTVNYFIGMAVSGFYLENADYDKDGAVTVSEIMQIVNIALQSDNANSFNFCREATADKMMVAPIAGGYAVSLCNNEFYTALQMDICLEDVNASLEAHLSDARANGHTVICNGLGNGRYRVIVYSLNGQELKGNDGILLQLLTNSRLRGSAISNLLLTNRQLEPITMGDITAPTSIAEVNAAENDAPAYNVQGVRTKRNTRGIVIQNGKKRTKK